MDCHFIALSYLWYLKCFQIFPHLPTDDTASGGVQYPAQAHFDMVAMARDWTSNPWVGRWALYRWAMPPGIVSVRSLSIHQTVKKCVMVQKKLMDCWCKDLYDCPLPFYWILMAFTNLRKSSCAMIYSSSLLLMIHTSLLCCLFTFCVWWMCQKFGWEDLRKWKAHKSWCFKMDIGVNGTLLA